MKRIFALVALAVLTGCATKPTTSVASRGGAASRGGVASTGGVATEKPIPTDWRRVATRNDQTRLHGWRDAFVSALAVARRSGAGARVAQEGTLLAPDAALDRPDLPPGRYRCRVLKLGGQMTAGLTAYQPFDCVVADEGEVASFAKLSGSQRPVGLVFDHDARRKIFLGTLMLGDEKTAIDYGRDADRDMAGAVERIDARRWRIVLPYPRFESMLDVIELVPAP